MSSPFRYSKKERKRWRQSAGEHKAFVEKFQSDPTKTCFIDVSEKMAEVCAKMLMPNGARRNHEIRPKSGLSSTPNGQMHFLAAKLKSLAGQF